MAIKDSLLIYRYCHRENSKTRPVGFSKQKCLESFTNSVSDRSDVLFVVDGVLPETIKELMIGVGRISQANLGSNLNSWLMTMSHALINAPCYEKIYFIEDDYAHRGSVDETLKALDITGVDYVSPYFNPDYENHVFHKSWDFEFKNDESFISAKSCCLTFACRASVFVEDYRHMVAFGLKDAVMWSALTALSGKDRLAAFTTSRSRGIGTRSAVLNDATSARLGAWKRRRTLVVPKQSHSVHLESGKIHRADIEWVERLLSCGNEVEVAQPIYSATEEVPRL